MDQYDSSDVSKEFLPLYQYGCLEAEELDDIRMNGLKTIWAEQDPLFIWIWYTVGDQTILWDWIWEYSFEMDKVYNYLGEDITSIKPDVADDSFGYRNKDGILVIILANEILFRFRRFHRGICG